MPHLLAQIASADMRNCRLLIVAMVAAMGSTEAVPHHSGAMWDVTKTVVLTGTVREFQWTNPHCWIQLLVPSGPEPSAASAEWSIEMAAPSLVLRGGWKPGTLKPGDRIRVNLHPARDGTHAGNFVSATGAKGEALGSAGAGAKH